MFVLTLIAEHLSGWAEEWVLWSTQEFSFLALPDALCTGETCVQNGTGGAVCTATSTSNALTQAIARSLMA